MLQQLDQGPAGALDVPAGKAVAGKDPQTTSAIKGVAVLGSHPATVTQAPFDDSWLIYACSPDNTPYGNSEHAKALPRVDQWFEMHVPLSDKTRPYGYLRHLETMPFVWMRDKKTMSLFPGAREYPERALRGHLVTRPYKGSDGAIRSRVIEEQFGKFSYYAFTSSIAYMMAKAIEDCEAHQIPAIGLWGIMQASQNEYAYQRQGIQYFIDQAKRRGIRVFAPDVSLLFEPMPDIW